MSELFGGQVAVSPIFESQANLVEPVAQTIAEYLANFDSDGETSVIYWACGTFGESLQVVGDLDSAVPSNYNFPAPNEMGTGTKLLPAIKYFTEERFRDCPWGIYLFITDGLIEDLNDVKAYTKQLATEISQGNRKFTKLVIIGLGNDFIYRNIQTNEQITADAAEGRLFELENSPDWEKSEAWNALEELDDLDEDEVYGCIKDSTEHLIVAGSQNASNMKSLEEIFAEVVSRNMIVAPSAEIVDNSGNPVTPLDRNSCSAACRPSIKVAQGSRSFSSRHDGIRYSAYYLASITQLLS